jgi:hypothetical protein
MSLRIDVGDMDYDRWEKLYLHSRNYCDEIGIKSTGSGTIDIYLNAKYNTERVSNGEIYEFDSKEKYTEFLLTWL